MKKLFNTICDVLMDVNLRLFDGNINTNVTTDSDLSDEMKVYYRTYLIRLAEPLLVHDQFAQKQPIPKNGGLQAEFRKYDSLPKAMTPLTEGVTPDGQKLVVTKILATVYQYGGYVGLSDILLLTAVDNNLMEATRLIASQAARTADTITREVINGGTNVQYGIGTKTSRYALVGGDSTAANNDYLTVDSVRRAVRSLKVHNAPKYKGSYVGIIHPDAAYDLMNDPKWENVKTYSDPSGIYDNEIGKIADVRFVESSEAKVFHAENLTKDARNLTVKTAISGTAAATIAVKEAITAAEAAALAGRKVLIGNTQYEIASASAAAAGSATITLTETLTVAADTVIYPGEAGKEGRDVYATLILGADAYGTTEIEGGGLQHIVKQLGSAGTADPLNQRATVGWKLTKAAVRLVEQYMVRVETASTFEVGAN